MFEHSVKVPQIYKRAAKITKEIQINGGNIKDLTYKERHSVKALYPLVVKTIRNRSKIDFLLKRSQLLDKFKQIDPWLARVLITELLWGRQVLPGESKPVKSILAYEQIFNAHLSDVHETAENNTKKVRKLRFVRVNTLVISVDEAIDGFRNEGWVFVPFMDNTDYQGFISRASNLDSSEFMLDINVKELLIFPISAQFHNHRLYRNGSIILQDKASCLPVHILNPLPGSAVLDMCAAPGNKTTQIAAKLNDSGVVFAVDRNLPRYKNLVKLTGLSGAKCIQTINEDILKVKADQVPDVEYILVDPSCSGSGMLNQIDNETRGDDKQRLLKLAGFQIVILKHALRNFPKAKRVVYSTCSIFPEENEYVVEQVLASTTNFKLVSAMDLLGSPWINSGTSEYGEIGKLCLSATSDDLTSGFFIAVFERLGADETNTYYKKREPGSSVRIKKTTSNEDENKNLTEEEQNNLSNSNKTPKTVMEGKVMADQDTSTTNSNITETSTENVDGTDATIVNKKRKNQQNDEDDADISQGTVQSKRMKKARKVQKKKCKKIGVSKYAFKQMKRKTKKN